MMISSQWTLAACAADGVITRRDSGKARRGNRINSGMWRENDRAGRREHGKTLRYSRRRLIRWRSPRETHCPGRDDAAIRANYAEALKRQGYGSGYVRQSRQLPSAALKIAFAGSGDSRHRVGDEVEGGLRFAVNCARSRTLPIIFLSARDSDFDIVSGFRLGADDYVTKDVSLPHLLARIAALFRRAKQQRCPRVRKMSCIAVT